MLRRGLGEWLMLRRGLEEGSVLFYIFARCICITDNLSSSVVTTCKCHCELCGICDM